MQIIIPERLKRFPLWQDKYPIFFTVFREIDGRPNWKSLDRRKQVECNAKGLCHLCGQRMLAPYWWVCGEYEMEELTVSSNGPMHEECARFACVICPALSDAKYKSTTSPYKYAGPSVTAALKERGIKDAVDIIPRTFYLCSSAGYDVDNTKQMFDWFVTEWLTKEVVTKS